MSAEEPDQPEVAGPQQKLEALVFYGMPAGFFFRQGLIMSAEGKEYGIWVSVAAFVVGALFVFPIRPFWQPVIAVAAGIGIAEIVNLF